MFSSCSHSALKISSALPCCFIISPFVGKAVWAIWLRRPHRCWCPMDRDLETAVWGTCEINCLSCLLCGSGRFLRARTSLCRSISQLGWVNGEECCCVTMKLSSMKLLTDNGGLIALPIFSWRWPDFTFHCCDGVKATWHLQTRFPLEMRLKQLHQSHVLLSLDPDF